MQHAAFEIGELHGEAAPEICEIIDFRSLFDFARWELMKAIIMGVKVRRCNCCVRYFANPTAYDYVYCEGLAPGETEQTCRMIGAQKSHEEKIKNDPIWAVYRTAYKKYHARVSKKKMLQSDFLVWAEDAIVLRDRATAGELTVEELRAQLNEVI